MPCGPRKVIQAQMSLMTTGGIRWSDLPSRYNDCAGITALDVRQLEQASIDNDRNYALLLLRPQRRERLSSVAKGRTGRRSWWSSHTHLTLACIKNDPTSPVSQHTLPAHNACTISYASASQSVYRTTPRCFSPTRDTRPQPPRPSLLSHEQRHHPASTAPLLRQ